MKELEIQLRVSNNRLKERRLNLGLSQRDLALACGLSCVQRYGPLETMRMSPVTPDGSWRTAALALATFYEVDPSELFPDAVMQVRNPVSITKADTFEVQQLIGGDARTPLEIAERIDSDQAMRTMLYDSKILSEREREILRLRFGIDCNEHTLREVGEKFGLSYERTRQIERRGLGKLRDCIEVESESISRGAIERWEAQR